jgi:arylformamidase
MPQVHPVKIFDISVPITNGGVVYPGNPTIRVEPHSQISKGAGANDSLISVGSHTATHVDAPYHFIPTGTTVEAMPLSVLIGPARLIAVSPEAKEVTAAMLQREKIEGAQRVLIHTSNSGRLRGATEFIPDFVHVTPDGAEYLVSIGVKLVGVDYLSVEKFRSGHHKTHLTLLGAGVIIVEGLDFSGVPTGEYTLHCLPLLIPGLDGAPARAVLTKP